jgi:hypothetical protein
MSIINESISKTKECIKFDKVIQKISGDLPITNKNIDVLLDNPLAFADFMSKYYNDCLKKKDNSKKLFSMTALNNPNIKLLKLMDEGYDYIDNLSRSFEILLEDNEEALLKNIKEKHGLNENQKKIILNGLKNMFGKVKTDKDRDTLFLDKEGEEGEEGEADEEGEESFAGGANTEDNIKTKKDIDNLLQTFLKRDSYNKVVSKPYKNNFKKYILNEFGINIHAYYNGMSLLHTVSKIEGEKQVLTSPKKASESPKESDDDELMLLLLAHEQDFKDNNNNDFNIGGGHLNLKKTKKKRLKNQKRNINKKRTHKKGGSDPNEDKINKILEQEEFKQFFEQNKEVKEKFNSLTNIEEKKMLIFYIYTRLMNNKSELTDDNPELPTELVTEDLNLGLFYDNEVDNLHFVKATLDEIKEALEKTINEDANKSKLVESLSNYINTLENEKLEKQFWFHILSIKPKNKINLKYPDWGELYVLSDTRNKSLKGLNESLKNQ